MVTVFSFGVSSGAGASVGFAEDAAEGAAVCGAVDAGAGETFPPAFQPLSAGDPPPIQKAAARTAITSTGTMTFHLFFFHHIP